MSPVETPSLDGALPSPIPVTPPDALVRGAAGALVSTPTPESLPEWVVALPGASLILPWGPERTFTRPLPEGSPLKVERRIGDRLRVYYAGDGGDQLPAEGLVEPWEVTPSRAPKWVAVRESAALRSGGGPGASVSTWLAGGAVLEVIEDAGTSLRVFYLGDGRGREAAEGWVESANVAAAGEVLAAESRGVRWIDSAQYASLTSGKGVWLRVPYRSQLDGSLSATANCGPATVAMALEFRYIPATNAEVRALVLRLQGNYEDPDSGVAIQYLQQGVEMLGLPGYGLYLEKDSFRRWTLEDLHAHIRSGRPVIPQLRFWRMPGRGDSDYGEDHYVVLTGFLGDDIIYNDPVDTDGPGFGRLISSAELLKAWEASYVPFGAFSVGESP